MSQLSPSRVEAAAFEQVGSGLTVYDSPEPVEGVVKWLETPEDVIEFAGGGDVSDVVVIARGGTTTFLTMALNAGVRGVVTLQGAPESHLGILCREYGIPCVMSVAFEKGVRTQRGETIPADGVRIRLDISSPTRGTVSVEEGAPVDDSPAPADAAPAMSPEQLEQIMALLANFQGTVPHGVEGDKIMQAEMTTRVLHADDESVHRPLTVQEVNEAIRYYTWNEWDALAARATEGESGLIPRQEYEAMGIMDCWFRHPEWLRAIEDAVGPDGVVEIGARARHEVGTKINMLHMWAMATATSFGRGIALELNLHDLDYKADRVRESFEIVRRLYKGLWGSGPILTSMRGFKAPVLDPSWIDRFAADRISLEDAQARSTFQRFNGAAELMGFLLHFDNRLGLGDTGPYPLADGGFVLVRDLFVNEPAFPWSSDIEGLPYAFTIAMFFAPDSGLETRMTDLSTVFTTPANYLPFVTGIAVYAREQWDTPMTELRTLGLDELVALRTRCEEQATALYSRVAAMSQREKIYAGAFAYAAGFALPFARAAGIYDDLVENHGFTQVHPAVEACYDTIVSGVATEMIPRLFLTGSWGNPVPEQQSDSLVEDASEVLVLHALRVRGFAGAEQVAASTGLDAARVRDVLALTTERGHTKERTGRISGHALTPAGKARHELLRADAVSSAQAREVASAYQEFLAPNRAFKQLTTDVQLGALDATAVAPALADLHEQVRIVLAQASAAVPWFGHYEQRLGDALARYQGGDTGALARPMSDSYHDVWMEVHEDLLATIGRARAAEDE
jgi:hypothetical protein